MKIKRILDENFGDAISPDSHMEFDTDGAHEHILQKYRQLEDFFPDDKEELKDMLRVDGDRVLELHQSIIEAMKVLRRKGMF